MDGIKIRALRPDEIECRVQRCTEKGVVLLLYKDARCDMTVLDETFGLLGWQRRHELIGNKEFCTVSVKADNGEWVSKQDCGIESNVEKAKGQTSDAFKRACVNLGIGRELYTKINIFVRVPTVKNNSGKYEMKDKYAKFHVSQITTDDKAKKILQLEIADEHNNVVLKLDNENPPKYEEEPEDEDTYKCFDCGMLFGPFTANGKEYTAEYAYMHSKKKNPDNNARCKTCREKFIKETMSEAGSA